ncbi:MAG: hypothetical protein R3A79_27825 [Nannocystaceae bacterium]
MSHRPLSPALARLSFALTMALSLAACGADEPHAAQTPKIPLTHQWNVPAGASLFTKNSLGAEPAAAADLLMQAMPNVVYRLGERCKSDPAFAKVGALTIEAVIDNGAAKDVAVLPQSSGADCIRGAVAEEVAKEKELLAGAPPAKVLVHLEHTPS